MPGQSIHLRNKAQTKADHFAAKFLKSYVFCPKSSCQMLNCRTIKCQTIKCQTIKCRTIKCRTIKCRTIKCRMIKCWMIKFETLRKQTVELFAELANCRAIVRLILSSNCRTYFVEQLSDLFCPRWTWLTLPVHSLTPAVGCQAGPIS
jgi:hypothetical protein